MELEEIFNNLSLNEIENYVTNKQEENLNLDFKTINKSDLSNKDDKRNLAKSLSGFANSNGGLIVWGIDARKNDDDIDCACEYKRIDNLKLFISRLNELTSRTTKPPVDGIKHKAVKEKGDNGFAVTYVPECDSGPIMAKLGEDRYYKRSGDTFYRMEHFDIADMFGKRRKPKLLLTGRYLKDGNTPTIFISIENMGKGIAKFPFVAFNCPKPFQVSLYGLDGNYSTGLPEVINPGNKYRHQYGGVSDTVIYPLMSKDITKLIINISQGPYAKIPKKVKIEYEIVAENMRYGKGIFELNINDSEL
ncbi:MAG: ATP-binding protein [Candidatus Cloacimonetes bacterium]|nr:ATP-binding protein [Candidatus Cloacimonadota bacterium]